MPLMGPELAQVLQACALGCLDQAPELSVAQTCSACVVAAAEGYPEAPRKGDVIQLKPDANRQRQLFHAGTRRQDDGQVLTAGGRVLTQVAQAADFDQAFTSAYEGLELVRFKGMQFRRDIGHQVRRP
jgi:phosphoribosylamine--glycine ligase